MFRVLVVNLGLFVSVACVFAEPQRLARQAGGPVAFQPPGDCISVAQREEAQKAIQDYLATYGSFSQNVAAGVPDKYPFYPLGGALYGDLFTVNFVDLDPTPGIRDWDCTDFTYDGHQASDVDIRSFGEQFAGVPIFAALDGVVVATHDGEFDMNTTWNNQPANYVIIDHGNGRIAWYFHMKKFSVAVAVNDFVRAGQQIGLVGSSGISTGPHLHFATYDNGVNVEPYEGACQTDESQWVSQTPINRDMYLRDLHITDQHIENYGPWPFPFPRRGMFVQGNEEVSLWINLQNLPTFSDYLIQIRRPDATLALDYGTFGFGNGSFWRWTYWWWRWNVNLNQLGTWHIDLTVNGDLMASAPFEVVATTSEIVNRLPYPVTWVLDPPAPTEDEAVFCRVQTNLLFDDPDYDIVRYHYTWTVDDVVVRDIRHAGHADALPAGSVPAGSTVECTVVTEDGSGDCPPEALVEPLGAVATNRTISFVGGSAGLQTAIRVKYIDLPPPYEYLEGTVMWVGPTTERCENSAQSTPPAGGCGPAPGLPSRSFQSASLGCDPYYTDWSLEGAVSLYHKTLLPGGTYEISSIAAGCSLGEESAYSTPIPVDTSLWGDIVKDCQTNPCGGPNNIKEIIDVVALLDKFKNKFGAIKKSRADVEPGTLDWTVNISDVTSALDAFGGDGYPFAPGPAPCL